MSKVNDMIKIRKEIEANKIIFKKNIEKLNKLSTTDEKVKLAFQLINYAHSASTGYYSSSDIENVFLSLAQENSLNDIQTNFTSNSVLHVMTESYNVGGHTRVVERWVESSPAIQTHSLVFTSAENHVIPKRLINAIQNKGGEIIKLPDAITDLEKALILRRLASKYQIVILHIHPYDVVPLIAFGHPEFKRPVAFFNHADHKFWVGISISDLIVNFRSWGEQRNINRRGALNNFLLGLPFHATTFNKEINKREIRDKLNLPTNVKIAISVGHAIKYKPITSDKSFVKILDKLLNNVPDLFFILLGPFGKDIKYWQELSNKYHNRLIAVGPQLPEAMFEYLHASDLVIDSYPMSGGTALLDAVCCFKPILSLECPTGQLDYVISSDAYCKTLDELINKGIKILLNKDDANKNIQSVQEANKLSNSMDIWQTKLAELTAKLASMTHQIHSFTSPAWEHVDDNDIYLHSEYTRVNSKLKIKNLLHFYTIKTNGEKRRELLLFNKFKIRITKKSKLS